MNRWGADVDGDLLGQRRHRQLILHRDAFLQHEPRNGPIHDAGIQEQVAERVCQAAAQG